MHLPFIVNHTRTFKKPLYIFLMVSFFVGGDLARIRVPLSCGMQSSAFLRVRYSHSSVSPGVHVMMPHDMGNMK
jgi:hypothetical protein